MKSYKLQLRGWSCESCGENLGNWHDNSARITAHSTSCTGQLTASVKRLSVEELGSGKRVDGRNLETKKALPRTLDHEDEEWIEAYLKNMSNPTT